MGPRSDFSVILGSILIVMGLSPLPAAPRQPRHSADTHGGHRHPIADHYCPGKICRLQPKFMISKALPRVEAGNDLNSNSPILREIRGRQVLGMFATMPHESWPNRLFPIAPASTSQTISKVRSSLWWRFLREEPLLLGSVPCHGVRTTDLPREPA